MLNKDRTKTKAVTKIQFWFLIDDVVLLFTIQVFISLGHIYHFPHLQFGPLGFRTVHILHKINPAFLISA